MTTAIKAAAAEVRREHVSEFGPDIWKDKDADTLALLRLLSLVDALPSDGVVVSRATLVEVRELLIADQRWHAMRNCPGNGGYAAEGVCICADMENNQAAIAAIDGVLAK